MKKLFLTSFLLLWSVPAFSSEAANTYGEPVQQDVTAVEPENSPSSSSSSIDGLKIDQILQTQKEILRKLDEISNEVEVVKVRASSR